MIAPAWMHEPITADQYDSWSEEQRAGIEVVDPATRAYRASELFTGVVQATAPFPVTIDLARR
jgi:hypothetical protein